MQFGIISLFASAGIKTSKIRKMYEKVWGVNGLDYHDKQKYALKWLDKNWKGKLK